VPYSSYQVVCFVKHKSQRLNIEKMNGSTSGREFMGIHIDLGLIKILEDHNFNLLRRGAIS
jgi:hypothetical protein